MADEVAERIAAFLDKHHVMSLATIGGRGPHAASLFYAREEFRLFWMSDPASRHSQDIAADGRVAATIACDHSGFAAIRGLQLSGRAVCVANLSEHRAARRILEARFPFLEQPADAGLRESYERAEIYRLEVARFVLIDNSRGFGHKDVWELRGSVA